MSRPLRSQDDYFHYGAYPYAAAIAQMGEKYQASLLPELQKALLADQKANGSWISKSFDKRYGNIHVTALAIMALSAELKHLSIHK